MLTAKQDLDHKVWKLIKHHSLQDKKILVALSGGLDSVALLAVLTRVHDKKLLAAAYFHHGEGSNQNYRDQAKEFCEQLCKKLDIPFFFLKSKVSVSSEDQYRQVRYAALKELLQTENLDLIATAHHKNDLLETRILRLIRGTGVQGIEGMSTLKDNLFRPLLTIDKSELKNYLDKDDLNFIEDPSNASLDPLRNWLRNEWIPALEKKVPGSSTALARSLETIIEEVNSSKEVDLLTQNRAFISQGLSRSYYLTLSSFKRRQLLAQYLFSLGKRDFSQAQLEEIEKRLDNSQKVIIFKVGGCHWEVNAGQIMVQS